MTIGKITSVSVVGDTALSIRWDDDHKAGVDLARNIARRAALAAIADRQEFARVALSTDGWSLEWPCGIDFGAQQLRRWADEQAGETMPSADFRAWINAHGFTLDCTAEALGLSRRTVAYYLSGEQPVPKTVMLATLGYDRRDAA